MLSHPDRIKVVLISPRNPLNIGAVARAISNFGILSLRLVDAYEVAYQEARSAVNAAQVLRDAQVYGSVADAVGDCELVVGTASLGHRDLHHPLYRLELGGRLIRERHAAGNVALLFGSEKFGLSNEDMSYCHWIMGIPTRPEHESMNLGQAVAVCLYELIRSEDAAAAPALVSSVASGEQVERLAALLGEALDLSGYVNPKTRETSLLKLRRLIHRLAPTPGDATVLAGMLRQILWKLRGGGGSS